MRRRTPIFLFLFLSAPLQGHATPVTPFLTISGRGLEGSIGYTIGEIGDVNGEDKTDLVLGAPTSSGVGHAYVFCGGSPADTIPCLSLSLGPPVHWGVFPPNFGFPVASIGDINGDGRQDLAIGVSDTFGDGEVRVFLGGRRNVGVPDLILLPPASPPETESGIRQEFGRAITGAGDINDDGYDDLLVGAPNYTEYDYADQRWTGQLGRAFVFFGSAHPDSIQDLALDTAEPKYSGWNYNFGYSVSAAGDMNGDHHPDIAVAQTSAGSCYGPASVFYGGPDLDALADRSLKMSPFRRELTPAMVSAGDFNDDGFDDLVVRAITESPDGCGGGPTYLYVHFGSPVGTTMADPDLILSGNVPDDIGVSIYGGRDVNGDGYPDILAGAHEGAYGRVYVFHGGPGADGVPDEILDGSVYLDQFGSSVYAMDMNRDGVSDVLVGAPGIPGVVGRVYVYDLNESVTARAFVRGEHRTLPIGRAGDHFSIQIESIGSSYETADIDPSTVSMTAPDLDTAESISSIPSKRSVLSDTDGNGIPELSALFSGSDLARLFGGIRGRRAVSTLLEGRLMSGRAFRAPLELVVLGALVTEHKPKPRVWPNPLNPRGELAFVTSASGPVTARLYDVSGRLVRTIAEALRLQPGEHSLTIEGVDDRGRNLATGVYFYQLTTPDGEERGRFVIAK